METYVCMCVCDVMWVGPTSPRAGHGTQFQFFVLDLSPYLTLGAAGRSSVCSQRAFKHADACFLGF